VTSDPSTLAASPRRDATGRVTFAVVEDDARREVNVICTYATSRAELRAAWKARRRQLGLLHPGQVLTVRRVARRAEIYKRIGPHTLRHAFITAALDAGVLLRDVQEAASLADPRTTMRYDRARVSLDRHATYIVATFIAGAAR
jgi:integrase